MFPKLKRKPDLPVVKRQVKIPKEFAEMGIELIDVNDIQRRYDKAHERSERDYEQVEAELDPKCEQTEIPHYEFGDYEE